MTELREIDNRKLLQELKKRITESRLGRKEVFQTLESKEVITECEVADLSKLTKED
jgi:hypothetical protein